VGEGAGRVGATVGTISPVADPPDDDGVVVGPADVPAVTVGCPDVVI